MAHYYRFKKLAVVVGNFTIGFFEEFREFNDTKTTSMASAMQDLSDMNVDDINVESVPKYVRRIGRAGAVVQGVKSFAQTPAGKAVVVVISEANPINFM
jgi:hypothetical protein